MTAIHLFHSILAIFGLGILVFIHELGHYFVALRQGMKVEAFAIGFGKPIFTWMRNGVEWRICMLPFGGYVKIAGMQRENGKEPSEIPDGFFGKGPWQRIKVAFAGPFVNIVFSLIVFSALWFSGGRIKPFAELTHHIGWVDPRSELYGKGVRPGDLIEKYDGREFAGFKDLLISSIMKRETTQISGEKIDYLTGKTAPFDYTLNTYANPELREKLNTIGVLTPARYLIYPGKGIPAGFPAEKSGIQENDRLLWVNGEAVFSFQQLTYLTNEPSTFLTIRRGSDILQVKVARAPLSELKLSAPEKEEIGDWQHEADLKERFRDLYFIPYNLSPTLSVEGFFPFIDELDGAKYAHLSSLHEGDAILAVDGEKVSTSYEFLKKIQSKKILMIVDRNPKAFTAVPWKLADMDLGSFNREDLQTLVSSIGVQEFQSAGTLHMLRPVTPKPLMDLPLTSAQKEEIVLTKKRIEAIPDAQVRAESLAQFEKGQKKEILGLPLVDREVFYNPSPLAQFNEVLKDTYRTLTSLFSGAASPKYIAGPVGIIQIVQQSWTVGPKEAFYWMALISLNLGIINLLPLPVLDGGHILLSFVEMVTRRPIKAKTMERLVVPFVFLLIGFFVFVTFHDISRLLSKFF